MPISSMFASLLVASAVANPATQLAPLLELASDQPAADAPPPSGEAAAPEADAPAEEVAAAPAPEASEAESLPAPPPPAGAEAPPPDSANGNIKVPGRGLGIGLLAGAGVAGAIAWGMVGWKATIVKDFCFATGDEADDVVTDGFACGIGRFATILPSALQIVSDAASFTLAGIGGGRLARADAAKHVVEGEPNRTGLGLIAGGAALAATGITAEIVLIVMRSRKPHAIKCLEDEESLTASDFYDCHNRRAIGFMIGDQASAMAIGAGIGMLVYGAKYRSAKRGYESQLSWNITPQIGRNYNGLAGQFRF